MNKKKKHVHGLEVRGTQSTVSMKKVLNRKILGNSKLNVLVGEVPIKNNAKDELAEINAIERKRQALYFVKTFPKMYPPYLVKYLKIDYSNQEDEFIHGIIDNVKSNREAQQVIGLIQLLCGGLRMAKKWNKGIRFYIVEPETHLHPKRQAAIMSVIHSIYEEETGEKLNELT
jgi:hypothetical protein